MNHPAQVVESSRSQIAVVSPCMQLLPIASASSVQKEASSTDVLCREEGEQPKSSTWGHDCDTVATPFV